MMPNGVLTADVLASGSKISWPGQLGEFGGIYMTRSFSVLQLLDNDEVGVEVTKLCHHWIIAPAPSISSVQMNMFTYVFPYSRCHAQHPSSGLA